MKKFISFIVIFAIIFIANIAYATEDEILSDIMVGDTISLKSTVNLRLNPTFMSKQISQIEQGTEVTIDMQIGNWYKITSETNSGWITDIKLTSEESEPLDEPLVDPEEQPIENETTETPAKPDNTTTTPSTVTSTRTGVVTVETARVRKSASTSSDIIATLDEDDVVTIVGEENGFYKITTSSINEGYVSNTLIKAKEASSRSLTEERLNTVSNTNTGNEVVAFAKQYLGYSYVLGGNSPSTGFDCSGFTHYVFSNFGYTLGRVAAEQTSVGTTVDRENLQAGDLLLFYDEGKTKIGHCGIYISGGEFIHSANPQRGVVTDNLNNNSYYSSRFVTAKRIV